VLFFSDVQLCTRHSGVDDCAAPPIFSRRLLARVRKSVPPLAVALGDP